MGRVLPPLPGQRRSLVDDMMLRLSRRGSPFASPAQASEAPYMLSDLPTDSPTMGVDMTPQETPLRRLPPLPGSTPTPPPLPTMRPRSEDMQDQLTAMDQPMSRKGTLLKSLASAAPIALGALFGGSVGASGAAEGVTDYNATQRGIHETRRKSLVEEIENQRNREERGTERSMSVDAQIQAVEQRAQAAEQAAKSREEVAQIRADAQREIGELRNQTAQLGQDLARQKQSGDLRAKGFKFNAQGQVVGVDESEMTPKEKAEVDYKQAATEHQKAIAEVERTKNDPNSPAFQQASQRLGITAQRLALSQKTYLMRAFGTDEGGNALPGSMIGDDGKPIGAAFQANSRPTGTQRGKANMASSAREQLTDITDIVQKHPEIFGPGHGQMTEISNWLGTQDPEAQRFKAARSVAAEHLAGTFGGRSEAALSALDDAVGKFKDNPEAMLAGLQQLDKAAKIFEDAGTVRTTGSNATPKKGSLLDAIKPKVGDIKIFPNGKKGKWDGTGWEPIG